MKRRVELSEQAMSDLLAAAEWYERHRPGWGDVFVVAIEATLQKISRSPEVFPIADDPVRRGLVRRFPFGVFYTIETDRIDVIAILHSSRHPDLWRERVQGNE